MELIVRHLEREERVHLERTDVGYRVTVGEATYEVNVAASGGLYSLVIDGAQHEVSARSKAPGKVVIRTATGVETVELMDPLTHLALVSRGGSAAAGARQVTAYMPGRVVEILVEEGEEIQAGQGVLVLEAMKMKNEIQAESAGVVKRILVEQDQAVEGGDPLFEIE